MAQSDVPAGDAEGQVFTDYPKGNCQYINFGKYKGKTFLEVYNTDPCYLMWLKKGVNLKETCMDIVTKLLDRECRHTIKTTEPSMKRPALQWKCTKCKKIVAKIPFDNCRYCQKSKPEEQLLEFGGCCWKCHSSLT